jgi:hypothetical protein
MLTWITSPLVAGLRSHMPGLASAGDIVVLSDLDGKDDQCGLRGTMLDGDEGEATNVYFAEKKACLRSLHETSLDCPALRFDDAWGRPLGLGRTSF